MTSTTERGGSDQLSGSDQSDEEPWACQNTSGHGVRRAVVVFGGVEDDAVAATKESASGSSWESSSTKSQVKISTMHLPFGVTWLEAQEEF